MHSIHLTRRGIVAGAASAAALLSLRQAIAQTPANGRNWMTMVQAHHALVAKTFDELLASKGKTFAHRDRVQQLLAYQLTAHSVAEENVLYPALAMNGLMSESDKLYLDQAHAKVMNAELEMTAPTDRNADTWYDKVRTMQAAVLKHAKEDEEGNLYPKLLQTLDAPKNALLTAAYQREFAKVRPMAPGSSGVAAPPASGTARN